MEERLSELIDNLVRICQEHRPFSRYSPYYEEGVNFAVGKLAEVLEGLRDGREWKEEELHDLFYG